MTWEQLIAFNLVLGASIISPGPAFLLALRTTLVDGRAAGLRVGLGLGLMAATWTAMALAGLEIVFQLFPWAYAALKICGAAYLLWVAYHLWWNATRPVTDQAPTRTGIRAGIFVNLGNPKSVLFAGSVLVMIFPAGLGLGTKAFIVANHLLLELLFYGALAFVLSRPATKRIYLGAKPIFDRLAAAILGLLGLRLLTDR